MSTRIFSFLIDVHSGDSEPRRLLICRCELSDLRHSRKPRTATKLSNTVRPATHEGRNRSRAKALNADSLRFQFPMDCSLWKVLPSGTRCARRTTTVRLTSDYCGLPTDSGCLTGEILNFVSAATNLAATFLMYHCSGAFANRTPTNAPPQINILATSFRVATPALKYNVEKPADC
jgi:hypothetical protein